MAGGRHSNISRGPVIMDGGKGHVGRINTERRKGLGGENTSKLGSK